MKKAYTIKIHLVACLFFIFLTTLLMNCNHNSDSSNSANSAMENPTNQESQSIPKDRKNPKDIYPDDFEQQVVIEGLSYTESTTGEEYVVKIGLDLQIYAYPVTGERDRFARFGKNLAYMKMADGKYAPGECACQPHLSKKIFFKWNIAPINKNELKIPISIMLPFIVDPYKHEIIVYEVEIPEDYSKHPEWYMNVEVHRKFMFKTFDYLELLQPFTSCLNDMPSSPLYSPRR